VRLDSALEISSRTLEEIYHALSEFLGSYHMNCIYVAKRIQYFVYEIISADPLSEVQLGRIGDFLEEHYRNLGDYFLAAGDSFAGISRAYDSYASAVILLQSSYFFPAGTLLTSAFLNRSETGRMKKPPTSPESVFAECLSSKNEEKTISLLNDLFGFYNRNHTMLPNHVKDLYYKLFVTLENARRQQQLTDWGEAPIMATLERCFTYQELHQKLLDKTTQYFTDLKNVIPENSTIFLIRDYISKNYMNETLSVKDISAHVFLSASYLCTFFKNETGQTLNQYLTEYRMEKAKQLLSDPRYRITDISSRVGYSDGNYFGKSFKKYTGMSPSEFRERMS
jgi:two-component system response regulator YesN